MDWREEQRLRDISVPEWAKASEVSPMTIYRVLAGVGEPQARTRRALLRGLEQFPVLQELPRPEPSSAVDSRMTTGPGLEPLKVFLNPNKRR